MKFLKYLRPGRVSTGFTVFVAAGFLINAILTGNGGSEGSQSKWRAAKTGSELVAEIGHKDAGEAAADKPWVDAVTTGSISRVSGRDKSGTRLPNEPSVLSLIESNSDSDAKSTTSVGRVSITIQPGETLFAIGRRHGLGVAELARLNDLEPPYTIKAGQTIYIVR